MNSNRSNCKQHVELVRPHPILVGRCSSVGIVTFYGIDGPGIESRRGVRFSAPVRTGPGAQPVSYTMGTGSLSRW
jgi:hypothetical protein